MLMSTLRDSVLEALSAGVKANRCSIERSQLAERVVSSRRAAGDHLPSNHVDITAKILLRLQDAGKIQLQNKGSIMVIYFTESGIQFFKQWVKPARGPQRATRLTKREAVVRYREHAKLLIPVRDALVGAASMDHRLWDAEMVPVVIQEHMNTIENLYDGIAQLQNNLDSVRLGLESAERCLAKFGYCVDEDGNVVEINKAL